MMSGSGRVPRCAYSLALLVAVAAAAWTPNASACAIPVYRYAIENWVPEGYQILNFHRGAGSADDQALSNSLLESHANASIIDCNLDQEIPKEFQALWEAHKTKPLPYMLLVAPPNTAENSVLWSGPWNKANVEGLIHSPLRKKLTSKIESGDSAVWILIESGKKATDDPLAEMFEKTLRELSERFTAEAKANADSAPADPNSTSDRDLEQPAPEPVKLSVLRATHTEATDDPLFSGLLREQLKKDEACAVLVFGRGRMLGPLPEKSLTPRDLEASTGFLTGPCMCTIKEQRIGVDLLLDLDADKIRKPRKYLDIAPLAEPPAKPASAVPVNTPPTPSVAPQPTPSTPQGPVTDSTAPASTFDSGFILAAGLIAAGVVVLLLFSRKGSA